MNVTYLKRLAAGKPIGSIPWTPDVWPTKSARWARFETDEYIVEHHKSGIIITSQYT